jgi:sulfocyanin
MKPSIAVVVALAAATALAPVALSAQTSAPAKASSASPSWMKVDAAKKSVHFEIALAENGNNGTLNINGYGHGALTITVPKGWTVNMHVTNAGAGAIPHSLEVLPITESIPAQGSEPPVFAGAETVSLIDGMKVGQSDEMDFVADTTGKYWLFCGVPNHGVGGMWDYLVVSSTATAPMVKITP